jgi:hypothetical protein
MMTKRSRGVHGLLVLAVLSIGLAVSCGGPRVPRVKVPPRVDLSAYGNLGMVQVSVDGEADLQQLASERLLAAIQAAQPGTPILELGSEQEVLAAVGHERLDAAALRAVGQHYGVDAVITGHLTLSKIKPRIGFSSVLTAVSAQAEVEGALNAKLLETQRGATVWANGAQGQAQVAALSLTRGVSSIGASDPEKAYGRLVQGLVDRLTWDFRPHYE